MKGFSSSPVDASMQIFHCGLLIVVSCCCKSTISSRISLRDDKNYAQDTDCPARECCCARSANSFIDVK
jgi:hypothetical protein